MYGDSIAQQTGTERRDRVSVEIRSGYNKAWDFGAGPDFNNRYPLSANNGAWPNLIQFNLLGTNTVTVGATNTMKFYYQYGSNLSATASVRVFLDTDLNPFNGNAGEVYQGTLPGTGTNGVNAGTIQWANPTNLVPGFYGVCARISAVGRSRYLYAPEILILKPSLHPPSLSSNNLIARAASAARYQHADDQCDDTDKRHLHGFCTE